MDKRIPISIFEDCAGRFANANAVEATDAALTYSELDLAGNQLANNLLAARFTRGSIAAVFIPNSAAYILSIIGIQKACGVFMPADPNAPHDRQAKMFEKAEPAAVIVDEPRLPVFRHFAEQSGFKPRLLIVVSVTGKPFMQSLDGAPLVDTIPNNARPAGLPDPDDDLYVIFTSGTTGTPKAVLGRQKGLAHFIAWERTEFAFDETLRVSNLAPTTFDVSLRDIFVPLSSGGTVAVPDEEIKTSPRQLLDWLVDRKLSLVHIVPSIFRLLLDELEKRPDPRSLLSSLRYFMLAGEAVYGRDVIRFKSVAGDSVRLINLYGPTETTLAKLFCRLDFVPDQPARIMPLGNPISNTAVIILVNNRLAEIGEIGEICIKTPFRSKGYFRDPELTAAAFAVNPLTGDADDIIYRTGDMGRYLPDRSVEFAGRLDRQVKVNGVRVELSEVDEAVSAISGIKQAMVMPHVRDNGETSLICYFTETSPVDITAMRTQLSLRLYNAMIPAFYVRLETFPLGINGKIDRRALPKPEEIIYEGSNYTAPETPAEQRLAAIWSEILGIGKVGVTTSFNSLGGGSMQAIRCVGSISRAFGINLGIQDLFAAGTIRALAARIEANSGSADIETIPRQPERPDYPATHSQQRLWTLHTMLPGFTAFNISGCYRVKGAFNEKAFEKSLETVIRRHEILRTIFFEHNGELRQRVLPLAGFHLDHPDSTASSFSASDLADNYARTVFDLTKGPLLRAGVWQDGQDTLIVFVIHHIICDAWSLDLILREILQEYHGILKQASPKVASPALQYRDFAAWQQARLSSGKLNDQREFWLETLKSGVPRLDLPLDAPRPPRRTYHGSTVSLLMPGSLPATAKTLAASHNATLFAVLLAGLRTLLFRYTGQTDIVVNMPVTLRGRPELDAMPGDFTNTVLLSSTVKGGKSFSRLVEEAARDIDSAMNNREYPFDLLVQALNVKGDLSRAPVTDVGITLVEDYGTGHPEDGLKLETVDMPESISKYDLVFHFNLAMDGLSLSIEYDTAIFNKDKIKRMADNLATLLTNAISEPKTPVSALTIIDPAEQGMIKRFQLPSPRNYPDSTIHGAFQSVAVKQPDACALVLDDGSEMTFAELDRASNRIAAMLAAKGYDKGTRIAVHLHRGHEVPAAILGILKAGCIYVPLADDLPPYRIAYMLSDCEARAVIVADDLSANLPASTVKLNLSNTADFPDSPIGIEVSPSDEAYVIYTSGSTGRPKGTRLPHRGLVNRARDLRDRVAVTASDRFTQFASLSFDASIYEMFCSLLNGASLVVVKHNTITDPDAFVRLIEQRSVTFTLLPPTYVRRLNQRQLPGIRVLKTAGEAADAADSIHYAKTLCCLNGYGPTEDSICTTAYTVDPNRNYPLGIPIGTPVMDTEVLVLDRALSPVPIGVPGQLCVSDTGLSFGYINLPETTGKVFVPHPFDTSKRMYLTGDLARWEPDGNLLFLGRIDQQVKIGGHRIEPGEIEQAMRDVDGVVDTCVIPVGEANDRRLAAYYSGLEQGDKLRAALSQSLPSYMIPHFFIHMDAIPMTISGKIDRKALPSVEASRSSDTVREGKTANEQALLTVLREVLGSQLIGIDSNFFSAGGDSIRAIQVAARLREQGWALSAGEVFVTPVIRELASVMSRTTALVSTEPVTGPVPATPILQWFMETVRIHPAHFNQAVMLKTGANIDWPALKAALSAVWHHHDALRMVTYDGHFLIHPEETHFEPVRIDLDAVSNPDKHMREIAEKTQQNFTLAEGPLFTGILFSRKSGDRLMLIAHHLVIDAVSWGILVRDIETAYDQAQRNNPIQLPAKTHSVRDWAEALQRVTRAGTFDPELPYWQSIAGAENSTVATRSSRSGSMALVSASLEGADTMRLLDQGAAQDTHAKLLAALATALHKWNQFNKVLIQLEGHGRGFTGTGLDISRTIGWFTVSYPFLLDCSDDVTQSFETIHRALKDIPNGGIGYGSLRYLAGHKALETTTDISFNYLGRLEFSDSRFSMTDDPVGETVSPDNHLGQSLEFLLSVVNDKLEIQLTYDTGVVPETEAHHLLGLYRSSLVEALACHASAFDYNEFGAGGIDGFLDNL